MLWDWNDMKADPLPHAMTQTLNVLLMLSNSQPPNPLEEVQWHAQHCAETGKTAVATTQLLSGLIRGKSVVAFYGDADLGNQYLARGLFAGFAKIDETRGRDILKAIPLYANRNYPVGIRGVIELTQFRLAGPGEKLEELNGKLKNFKPLSIMNLPEGQARSRVYFISRAG